MKSTRTRSERGILLVITLVIIAVTLMFLGAGLTLSQSSGALAGSSEDQQLALEGAQAGVTYARSRLQENPNWHGSETKDLITVNMPGQLWVRENNGNVLGIVGQGDRKCAFRIRFNYQDGNGPGGDTFKDPLAEMRFDNVYVSENNLNSASQKRVFRADQSGWSVDPSTSFSPYDCVRYSATVLSEGLAGDGLRDLSPANLTPAAGNRRITRRVAEVVMGRNLSQMGDAPIYGAKTINMNVNNSGQVMVRSADAGVPPRARTLESIYIQDPITKSAKVDMTSKGEAYFNGAMKVDGADPTGLVVKKEDSSGQFPRVNWSQITKAAPSATNVDAGTYVWRRDGVAGKRWLDYYAQPFDPLVGPPASTVTPDATYNSSNPLAPGAIAMDTKRLALTITKDIYVNPVGALKSIAIVPEVGLVAAIENRPNVDMAPAGPSSPAPVITSQGDIFVRGTLRGQGSVTTEGSITFQGTSVLEADQDSRTAIYAKGDVTLEEMPSELSVKGFDDTGSGKGSGGKTPAIPFLDVMKVPPFGPPSFRDISFSGLFYTQGNIKADFPSGNADLYFRGMVVAFGADPETGANPGSAGSGNIDFNGGNVYLEYDSRYVVGPLNLTGPAKLELTSYNLL